MTEPSASDPVSTEGQVWLDGLAGRPGSGEVHAEGRLLRRALEVHETLEMPPWAEIERRAAMEASPGSAAPSPLPPARTATAANEAMWGPWHSLAAGIVVCIVLAVTLWPADKETAFRGISAGAGAEATWFVASPQESANGLANELRALGATVDLSTDGGGFVLRVAAPDSSAAAVNQRLAALETALDASGQLVLRVKSPP